MKSRRISSLYAVSRNSLGLRAAALLLAAGASSPAATLWWDGGGTTVNSASDNATTTAQNWLSGGNWDNGTTSAPVVSWTTGDSAVFGGTAATQTVTAGALTIGNLTFGQGAAGTGTSGTAYTVSGGTLTLSGSTITANTPTTLSSVLGGSTGLTTAGSSTLTLGGNNTYTGDTSITSGTLKLSGAGAYAFRYYRFTVNTNNGDGYNQIGELHYYNNGVWTAATAGSAAPTNGASGTEQFWGNLNDNKGANVAGFTKFGINTLPYSIVYDFGAATTFNAYNWSTANDSTPARNPKRWVVSGSNDNAFWIPLDDRSATDNSGPSATYNWSSPTGTYTTVTNSTTGGAATAYPISAGSLPASTNVLLASGANLDLNGCVQIVASLGNIGGGGGSVINSGARPVSLALNAASGSATFSGAITDTSATNAITLSKIGAGTQILTGNNTYRGPTNINAGVIQLASGGHLGTGALLINNGSFDLNGQNQTVSNLSGTGGSATNSAATDSTLTVTLPINTAGNFAGTLTSPSTGKLNLTVNSTTGGNASNVALSNAANTFKGTITVNGTGFIDGVDGHGVLGFNTEGALGDVTNPIVLTNGGTICNMFNPAANGGWPGHAVFTLSAGRTITVNNPLGGVVRIGYSEQCTINSLITGPGAFTKVDGGGVILGGSISNDYAGGTNLGGNGKLVLAKTGGAIAIPGNINLASTGGNGNLSGIVLAGEEQIVDTAILTWANTNLTGGAQGDSFFRLNGHTETVGGLVSTGNGPKAVIENRGLGDVAVYPTGTVIVNVTGSNSYTYNGSSRDTDQGTNGGTVAITKIGTGTQVLSGSLAHSGATTVTDGSLVVNGLINNSSVTASGTGVLSGTGTLGKPSTITAGGILSPGVGGSGTLTSTSTVTIGSGGKLLGTGGTLAGPTTIASGGLFTGIGGVAGALLVQADGNIAPGDNGIGNLNTTGSVTLSGNATFEINKTSGFCSSDTLTGFTSIAYGGTLTIVPTGEAPALGDTYQLFVPGVGASFSGSFSSIVGLPALAPGLQWETTGLIGTGQIRVVNYVSTPSFNPVAGGYIGAQSVTITSDSGSTIYYTTDGSPPTGSSTSGPSPLSGIAIPVDASVTVRAFARKAGQADSPIATAIYNTVTSPKWNIDGGGLWSEPSNWLNSVSPNGSGVSVDITYPQSLSNLLTLDAARTVGSLTFGNSAGNPWLFDAFPDTSLTLNTPSGTPTITVLDVATTISAPLAGTQGLAKAGPGDLTLSATNSYTGNTAVNGGVLSIGAFFANGLNSPLGAGSTMSFDGGTLRYTGGSVGAGTFNRDITLGAGGGTLETSIAGFWFTTGVISGPGTLTKTGTNQLIMQSTNTFDGVFNITSGEVQIRNINAMGSTVGGTVVTNGARLCVGGNLTGNVPENLELNGHGGGNGALQGNDSSAATFTGNINLATTASVGGGSAGVMTLSGAIGGAGGLTKLTANPVTLNGAASNTYLGDTTLGGTGKLVLAKTGGAIAIPGNINLSSTAWNGNASGVVLGGEEQIADSSIITWTTTTYDGATQQDSFLRINGHTETVGGLVSEGSAIDAVIENRGFGDTATYGTGTVIINTTGSNTYSYNGYIRNIDGGTATGVLALTKTGTGTQILRGAMTNTGTTNVNGGTLELSGTAPFPVAVASGGTLSGTGSTSGTLTVNAGGTVAPGNPFGTLTVGATTIAGTFAVDGDAALADRLTVNGNLDITGATLAINATGALTEPSYIIASYTGTLTGTFTVTGLPSGSAVQYDTANKQILLVQTPSGYGSWASGKGLSTGVNDGLSQDPEKDGISNLMEFYLDGNPLGSDTPALLTETLDPTYLVLTFRRRDDANGDVASQFAQYGSDVAGWTSVSIGNASSGPDVNGVIVNVVGNGTNPDTINVLIPRNLDAGGKLFGRIKVSK